MSFQFPNLKDKLDAPAKKSAFEKAKAEAEAKRQREAAETAAVYEDFVKSFEDESPRYRRSTEDRGYGGYSRGSTSSKPPSGPSGGRRGGGGDYSRSDGPHSRDRRHDDAPGAGSGFSSRKREFDTYKRDSDGPRGGHGGPPRGRGRGSGVLGFEDPAEYALPKPPSGSARKFTKFAEEDDEDDREGKSRDQPKPTIHLTHLPPKIAKPFILDLLKPYFPRLTPNQISLQMPSNASRGPSESSSSSSSLSSQAQSQARKSTSALITLASETASSEIDAVVNGLANKYLGQGYRLGISRHLLSTALHSAVTPLTSQGSAPFGARQLFHGGGGRGGRGYAPPPSYSGSGGGASLSNNRMRVTVAIPKDLRVLKLVNKTIEAVLTHGPEFEALLMATPSVINDERFAWLWDCRAPEHVYYRWKLWDVVTSDGSSKSRGRSRSYAGTSVTQLFENGAMWELPPKRTQKFEFITRLEDFVDDYEYHSSSDEDEDHHQAQDSNPSAEETKTYLGPLRRAKLMHLLSRIPMTTGTLRRGDVARVTAFAVENAYAAEEVADVLCGNVVRPVALSKANPDHDLSDDTKDHENGDEKDNFESNEKLNKQDTTALRLIGLYLISDVLSNSGLGVRNVWRYRQILDQRLRECKVFESLAEVALKENWGKIRQEKWRRSIQVVMSLWENWNIFPSKSHEEMKQAFAEPTAAQNTVSQSEGKSEQAKGSVAASRWKSVMAASAAQESIEEKKFNPYLDNAHEAKPIEEDESEMVDAHAGGEAMDEDEDVDGIAMANDDENVDGVPMTDSDEGMEDDDDENDDKSFFESAKDVDIGKQSEREENPESGDAPEKRSAVGFKFQMGSNAPSNSGASSKDNKSKETTGANNSQGRRKRMRAEDMFAADEDEDDDDEA